MAILIMSLALFLPSHKEKSLNRKKLKKQQIHNEQTSTQKFKNTPIVQYLDNGDSKALYLQRDNSGNFKPKDLHFSKGEKRNVDIFMNETFLFNVPLKDRITNEDWKFDHVDSIMVISDIEGNFDALSSWLIGNHVVDDGLNWTFGKNHLVFNGDIVDRGDMVFLTLWLIYKLEGEAANAGGGVHFVLGNHEQLNFHGKFGKDYLIYVNDAYFKDDDLLGIDYNDRFGTDTEMGRWLRSKNAVIQINDIMFAHGGLSKSLVDSGLSIDEVNDMNRRLLDKPNHQYNSQEKLVGLGEGPLWYRGLALQEESQGNVDFILKHYDINKLVIGHTIINETEIVPLYNGKVIPIDLHHYKSYKTEGLINGLLISGQNLYQIDSYGSRTPLKCDTILL